MEPAVNLEEVLGREDFDLASYQEVYELLQRSGRHRDQWAALLDQLEQRARRSSADQTAVALKLGLGRAWLGQYRAAAEWLQRAKRGKEKHYYYAQTLRHLGEYDGAVQEFGAAASAGWDALDCAMERVETLLLAGRVEPAGEEVDRIRRQWPDQPRGHVARGCLLQKQGLIEAAIEAFQAAVNLAPDLVEARFRLAYALDLHGGEADAVEHYKQCVVRQPAYVHALMNLAVIYEDMSQLDEAEHCLHQVLVADPNHARARLFLRDIQSARTMYIDEDQERMREKRDAVLEMPINEFELSVRSRNCLKKMNINTIGDLLRISEAELLAYKNFGETSLAEIKNMLSQKGLRLGQLLQEQQSAARRKALQTVMAQGSPEILDKPVGELELSVRARKCLQRLNVQTLGDLASRTEAELMGTKNFGQTSLNEVKQRLTEYGLSLRQINE